MVSFNRTIAEYERNPDFCDAHFWEKEATGTIDLFKYAAWLVDGKPRPIGRQKTYTSEEQKAKKRAADLERIHEETKTANEIGEIPFKTINWERRLACKNDQMLFEKTYLPTICEKPNADYHIILAERIAETIQNGGRQAILLPRGGGKTMKCRSGAAHGILYGRIRWGYNLSANEQQAKETMETLKTWFSKNPILLEDFPEICFPLSILGTKHTGSVVRSQTFQGVKTNVVWGNEEFRCPSLILPEDVALWYQEHDPESVKKVVLDPSQPENYFWIPTSSYAIFSSQGIQSGIRGGNVTHPQTLASIRPNFVILDDIQNDQTAASMVSVSKLEGIINNAVSYLAKPGEPIALLMPCTVIESDDLADTYGDPEKKPEWRGIRVPMITQWPKGMDNVVISQETETAKLWLEYAEIRRKSLRKHGDIRDATEFYKTHQTLMDEGFTVSWDARFYPNEVSAIQHAMNLRFSNHQSFLSNMQQVGKNVLTATEQKIRWSDFCEKMADYDKGTVPADTQRLVAYIDIQAEYFAYVVLAVSFDLSCCFIADYGTFPDFKMANYRRRQANSWRLLTKSYMAARMLPGSREKLNIDDVYTWGLRSLLDDLFARPYIRADENNTILHIHHIALDAQEGIEHLNHLSKPL
ncbi:MAG: hypothetical protein Q4D62_04665 [Planctomycetia bacterium]|nr:hypothetical protein [Planctomycetia bacterium]